RPITRDDMLKFWKQGYVPGNPALVLAGDITADEAHRLAERYFGSWKGGGASKLVPPPVETKTNKTVYIVDKPAAPQTYVIAGGLGVPRSSPAYLPIDVWKTVLECLVSHTCELHL